MKASIYWYFLERFLELSFLLKVQRLDFGQFQLVFGCCHYNFKHIHSVTHYFVLSDVNYLSMISFSCGTWLRKINIGRCIDDKN